MKTERVVIPCGEIDLEGALHLPDGVGPFPGVVVCHPHPLYGGNMDNSVVMTVCDVLVARSVAALRFNFRGAGGSGGSFGAGIKERDDVKAALDFIERRPEINRDRLGLAGYSFGGGVAFPVAWEDERVKRLALISPALGGDGWNQLKTYSRPKMVLLGDADTVVPYAQLNRYSAGDKDVQVVAGADHFWWGFAGEVGKRVGEFFKFWD